MNQQYPSILLEKAVGEFAKLPGVGRKTAMRLVLHLLRQDTATATIYQIPKHAVFVQTRYVTPPPFAWLKPSVT